MLKTWLLVGVLGGVIQEGKIRRLSIRCDGFLGPVSELVLVMNREQPIEKNQWRE